MSAITETADAEIQNFPNFPTVTLPAPPSSFINDKTNDRWKLLEDAPVVGEPVLELVMFLHSGETRVKGDVMFKRAVELGNRAGQQHANRLLAQQEIIPKEWYEFYLIFPGTKCRRSHDDLFVPYLDWGRGGWFLGWRWLSRVWPSSGRLVRCK